MLPRHFKISLFPFGQPLTLHQPALVLAATSQHHLVNQKMNGGLMKDRLSNYKLKNCTKQKFRTKECY